MLEFVEAIVEMMLNNITIITIIISLITTIILIINLLEYKKQNRKLYEPKLFPITNDFELYMITTDLNLPEINKKTSENNFDEFFIEIRNIGQGLAKSVNVNIEYNINIENIIKKIVYKIEKNKSPIKLILNKNNLKYKYYKNEDNWSERNYFFKNEVKIFFDYCLPIDKSKEEHIILKIPEIISFIIKMNCFLIYLNWDYDIEDEIKEINNISCKLKIEYLDIMDKKYKDEYILRNKFINTSIKTLDHGPTVFFNINLLRET